MMVIKTEKEGFPTLSPDLKLRMRHLSSAKTIFWQIR